MPALILRDLTPRCIQKLRTTKTACDLCSASSRLRAACPAIAGRTSRTPCTKVESLGYSLVHAFGAAFDNPDLIVACVIGDGESETCPLEGSWKSVNFLNPVRDGAVLPILHLNGYKISGPTAQGRTTTRT